MTYKYNRCVYCRNKKQMNGEEYLGLCYDCFEYYKEGKIKLDNETKVPKVQKDV